MGRPCPAFPMAPALYILYTCISYVLVPEGLRKFAMNKMASTRNAQTLLVGYTFY